MAEFSYW